MTNGVRCLIAQLVAMLACAIPAHSQQAPPRSIPVRALTPAVATPPNALTSIVGVVRQLPDGRVLVNDAQQRQLVIFDPTLTKYTVVASNTGAPSKYGPQLNGLMPYLGDSTVFVDRESQALIVLSPSGKIVRTMAAPTPSDVVYLVSSFFGAPGFDSRGRLIYRAVRRQPPPQRGAGRGQPRPPQPDSAPIMRADFETRAVDTIAMLRVLSFKMVTVTEPGATSSTVGIAIDPLPLIDDWALLPDGTVAIVRGRDYHIDWVQPDGKVASSPKMPFDWRPVTTEDRARIIDSVKKAHADEVAKAPPPAAARGRAATPSPPFVTYDPSELPDYYPPLRSGAVKADLDGNVWILPRTSLLANAGPTFDVVNRKGAVFERVQLPPGRALAGFGPNGVVYMTRESAPGHLSLERARVLR